MKTLLTALLIMFGSIASAEFFHLEEAEDIFLKGKILKISDSRGYFEALIVYKKTIYICTILEPSAAISSEVIKIYCKNTVIK